MRFDVDRDVAALHSQIVRFGTVGELEPHVLGFPHDPDPGGGIEATGGIGGLREQLQRTVGDLDHGPKSTDTRWRARATHPT